MKNEQQITQEPPAKTITIAELTDRKGQKKYVSTVNSTEPNYEAHKCSESLAREFNKAAKLGFEIKILAQ